ncbi:MAG: hypothetical protein IH948_07085 [Bacteroidetes bacterium]|nr:hypothetical protein [Bacteroidota bacterium]
MSKIEKIKYWNLIVTAVLVISLFSCASESKVNEGEQVTDNVDCEDKIIELQLGKMILMLQLQSDREIAQRIANTVHEVHFNSQQIVVSKQKIKQELAKKNRDKSESEEKVIHEMQKINLLQEMNQQKIAELNSSTGSGALEIDISRIIKDLNIFSDYEKEGVDVLKEHLIGLNYKLDELNLALDKLTFENEINSGVIELYEAETLTAYYCVGDFKSLNDQNIVERKGGVAGLGRVEVITKDFNKDGFTRIDINKTQEIAVEATEIEILSNHPENSYEIKEPGNGLIISITDVDLFWHSTKYLVVVKRK